MMHFPVFIMQKEQEYCFLERCCSWWCCHMLSKHYAGGWNACPGTGKSELSQTFSGQCGKQQLFWIIEPFPSNVKHSLNLQNSWAQKNKPFLILFLERFSKVKMYNLGLDMGTRILFLFLISLVDISQVLEFCICALLLKGSNMFLKRPLENFNITFR